MKIKKLKFLVSISLVFSLLVTTITFSSGSVANASSESVANVNEKNEIQSISDLKIIDDSLDNFEYTYEQEGEFYKVVEHIKSNSEVESQIFKKNKKGNYVLESEKLTVINDGQVKVETVEDNKTTIESFNLDNLEINSNTPEVQTLAQELNKNSGIVAAAANPPLTDWTYSRTDKYSLKTIALTVAALAAVLANRVTGGLAKDFLAVASVVISANLPSIYVSTKISYRYIKGTYLPRGEKSTKTVYSNSARTKKVGSSVTTIYYTPGWP